MYVEADKSRNPRSRNKIRVIYLPFIQFFQTIKSSLQFLKTFVVFLSFFAVICEPIFVGNWSLAYGPMCLSLAALFEFASLLFSFVSLDFAI